MTTGEMAVCAAPNCKELFKKKAPNHLYHSKSCKRSVENMTRSKQLIEDIAEVISPRLFVEDPETVEFLRKEVQRLGRELSKTKMLAQERSVAVYNAIVEGLQDFVLPPVKKPEVVMGAREERVPVLVIADVQLSKVTPSYNTEVAERRMYEYIEQAMEWIEFYRDFYEINEVHVWFLGDIIEGQGIFSGQNFLVDAGFYRQVTIHGPRIFSNCLRRVLETVNFVKCYCVIGNHGRLGSQAREEFDAESNGDRMLYRILDHIFATEERIQFVIPDGPWERNWYAVDTIGNFSALLLHGDQFQGIGSTYSIGRKLMGWKDAISETWQHAFCGHFHQSMKYTFGKTTLRIAPSSESDNTYAQEKLASTGAPAQLLLFVDPTKDVVESEYEIGLT